MRIERFAVSLIDGAAGYLVGRELSKRNPDAWYAGYLGPVLGALSFIMAFRVNNPAPAAIMQRHHSNPGNGRLFSSADGTTADGSASTTGQAAPIDCSGASGVIPPGCPPDATGLADVPDGLYDGGWTGYTLYIDVPYFTTVITTPTTTGIRSPFPVYHKVSVHNGNANILHSPGPITQQAPDRILQAHNTAMGGRK